MAPVAFAGNGPAGSEVNNRKGDFVVDTYNSSTQGFAAAPLPKVKRGPVGDFIDETPQQSNERSNSR